MVSADAISWFAGTNGAPDPAQGCLPSSTLTYVTGQTGQTEYFNKLKEGGEHSDGHHEGCLQADPAALPYLGQ